MSSGGRGPPKHQNKFAWKPNGGVKINPTELGGQLRPFSDITGVCFRCKEQIDWKRKYGKYKPLSEPAKCQRCSKRNVRQAYHNLCAGCAKEHHVCAKCSCRVDKIIGRDILEVEAEQKTLEEAIKNARERDRRSLLRAVSFFILNKHFCIQKSFACILKFILCSMFCCVSGQKRRGISLRKELKALLDLLAHSIDWRLYII
ncbi:uncharacterized protein LOC130988691 isoform X1 [Salvia miltiorrhiza]|uniref:uncharacterized protein LOC130988691 isoform X1 n=1 Tax=Salvia miltiorrhiza TaxID=226208 RepID=UPI0025AC4824|nr:uncharacterized protein LOC130988691 isoform X1 [Salvia miltiorrhiza]